MYYKVKIDETGRNSLKDKPQCFNVENQTFKTIEEVNQYLIDHYGKLPKRRAANTIFQDPDATPIGFLYSYWNRDYSHNSKHWYQTDWVVVTSCQETPVLVN